MKECNGVAIGTVLTNEQVQRVKDLVLLAAVKGGGVFQQVEIVSVIGYAMKLVIVVETYLICSAPIP